MRILMIGSVICLLVTGTAYAADSYVGSEGCGMCHAEQKDAWEGHGHAGILRAVNGETPELPHTVTPPRGTGWEDITYLIGGARHYARFTDSRGYVMTGPDAQWTIDGETHTAFKPDIDNGTLSYDCITCHSVGWTADRSYENGVSDALEGTPGEWFENSVGCEACHGPGHDHAAVGPAELRERQEDDGDLEIVVDTSIEACGSCHNRNDDLSINAVAPQLLQSRQQYAEMEHNRKGQFNMKCVDCHDPHASSDTGGGIVRSCTTCHRGDYGVEIKIEAMQDLACEDCHMPFAARGAYDGMQENYHCGDTRSHIFGISTDPDYSFADGNGKVTLTGDGLARLTVGQTCYACHQSGVEETHSPEHLYEYVGRIH